jgi:hypothetical protein
LGSGVDVFSLMNESAIGQVVRCDQGFEISIFGDFQDGLGAIELMKENLHLWQNYIYI